MKSFIKSLILLCSYLSISGCLEEKPSYVKLISAPELNQTMQEKDIFLVDVHIPEQKHIKGTDEFIPYNKITDYQQKFPTDKSTPIYIYCEGGPMGNSAAKTLHELGYTNLINLEGGANAWKKYNLPLE